MKKRITLEPGKFLNLISNNFSVILLPFATPLTHSNSIVIIYKVYSKQHARAGMNIHHYEYTFYNLCLECVLQF